MTQRIIKYRAWDGEQMLYPEDGDIIIHIDDGGLAVYQLIENDPDDVEAISDYSTKQINAEVMQFTGLLDKHGKEIYEGDIRKEMLDGLFVGDPQREHYFVMVYIKEWTMFAWLSITSGEYHKYLTEGASALDTEMYWTYPAGQDEPNNVELVGNLYTTPELVDPKMIENGNS